MSVFLAHYPGRSFRSASRSFPIERLKVKFIPISRVLSRPSPPVIPGIAEPAVFSRNYSLRNSSDAISLFDSVPDPTPWFTEFVCDLNDALMYNPVQFVQEPLCCVCVASEVIISLIPLFWSLTRSPGRAGSDCCLYRVTRRGGR